MLKADLGNEAKPWRDIWVVSREEGIIRDYSGIYWGYIGIVEKKMETAIVDWGYMEEYGNRIPVESLYFGLGFRVIPW